MKLLALMSAFALTATGASIASVFRTTGVSVRVPSGWYATARPLTSVSDPAQRFAIASYPLRQKRPDRDCAPTTAREAMPDKGALIIAIEYMRPASRLRDFPARPKRFRLAGFANYECMGPSYLIRFLDAGRFFQVHVSLGLRAGRAREATVLRILDSVRVKPR